MRILRYVGLTALLTGLAVLSLGAFTYGGNLGGTSPPSSQCSVFGRPPDVGGPYYENTVVTGERTLFPLGITCTYDSPDDSVGPQTVDSPSWVATGVAYGTPAAMVVAATLLRPGKLRRRRSVQ